MELCVICFIDFLCQRGIQRVRRFDGDDVAAHDAGDEADDKNSLSHIALPPDIENDSFVATWGTSDFYNNDLHICQCWRAVGL